MPKPQSGILPDSSPSALFLTLLCGKDECAPQTAREACRAVPELTAGLAARHPDAGLISVVGVGSTCWERVFPGTRPPHLHPFVAVSDAERRAPSTPADFFLHIRSRGPDLNFLLAKAVMEAFGGSVERVEEIAGFRFLDGRDLTGFVDGTENPAGEERPQVAIVGDEDPSFAGGSYVNIQRYVHDLAAWESRPVSEQEQTIGRTKQDDVELDDRAKPPTAHIGRVVIVEDGEELEILRHSMPYGDSAVAGLYFVAYGRTPQPFEKMLVRMIRADEEGHYDHLLGFSEAVTGALFFVPSLDFLAGAGG